MEGFRQYMQTLQLDPKFSDNLKVLLSSLPGVFWTILGRRTKFGERSGQKEEYQVLKIGRKLAKAVCIKGTNWVVYCFQALINGHVAVWSPLSLT